MSVLLGSSVSPVIIRPLRPASRQFAPPSVVFRMPLESVAPSLMLPCKPAYIVPGCSGSSASACTVVPCRPTGSQLSPWSLLLKTPPRRRPAPSDTFSIASQYAIAAPTAAGVERARVLGVEDERAHRPEPGASPARTAIRGLEQATVPSACVDDVRIALIDEERVDEALQAAQVELSPHSLSEKIRARQPPGTTPVRRLGYASRGPDIQGLRVRGRGGDCVGPPHPGREIQRSPRATAVRDS